MAAMKQLQTILLLTALSVASCSPAPEVDTSEGLNQVLAVDSDFAQVKPEVQLQFPQDHREHPEYGIEWWYFTANLKDQHERLFALQWTLFRFAQGSSEQRTWGNHQSYLAHFNLHGEVDSQPRSWQFERFARGGLGNAGVSGFPLTLALDNWTFTGTGDQLFPGSLRAQDKGVAVDLDFSPTGPLVLHGRDGFSQKLAQLPGQPVQASFYYSQPFIKVSGQLRLNDTPLEVTGHAWFDHEWSSQYLDPEAEGWDWFSLHLSASEKLMLFRVRHRQQPDYWFGTLARSETTHTLTGADIEAQILTRKSVRGHDLPLSWHLSVPSHNINITTTPLADDQWIAHKFSYYEGALSFSGTHQGLGFMELTGY